MKSVKPINVSEYRGGKAKQIDDIDFPPVGQRDADIFENNLLIGRFRPGPENPGFRWKPSGHWLCKAQ